MSANDVNPAFNSPVASESCPFDTYLFDLPMYPAFRNLFLPVYSQSCHYSELQLDLPNYSLQQLKVYYEDCFRCNVNGFKTHYGIGLRIGVTTLKSWLFYYGEPCQLHAREYFQLVT